MGRRDAEKQLISCMLFLGTSFVSGFAGVLETNDRSAPVEPSWFKCLSTLKVTQKLLVWRPAIEWYKRFFYRLSCSGYILPSPACVPALR